MHITTQLTETLSALRRPEYTGPNRCYPCTAVNLVIALAVSVALAVLVGPFAALAAFGVSAAAIYVRGYLVPGTPALTKRYLPDSVLRLFGKAPRRFDGDLDAEATLVDLGVVVETGDDVELDPAFADAWYGRMSSGDGDTPRTVDLAAMIGVSPDDVDVEYHDAGACTAYVEDEWVGQWESRVAFDADVTADAVLSDGYAGWRDIPLASRSELLAALRVCLDVCPGCGGTVSLGSETVSSCCRTVDVIAADCEGCGARLFEIELTPDALD